MSFSFTESQQAAISHRGSALLVSAAAGSGKTRVLTQRLIDRILCGDEPPDITAFLVITYTRAAAAELRERILDELSQRAAQNPLDKRLRRQQNLCYSAHIGTIHSFCTEILREYCHHIGLSPAFKVIDDDRAELLKAAALDKILETKYDSIAENPDFQSLVDTVGAGRDDARLNKVIRSLHDKMRSHPYPGDWLRGCLEQFTCGGVSDIAETQWGGIICARVREQAQLCVQSMERALEEIINADDAITKAYGPNFENDTAQLRAFSQALEDGWDRARDFLPIVFGRLGSLRNYENGGLAARVKAVRDEAKDAAAGFSELLSASSERAVQQLKGTYPAMKQLSEIALAFDAEYSDAKNRQGFLDFSDLEHLAARLLVDKETGLPTWAAFEISQRFSEVMVDEYQDVNAVQEMILKAVSQNGRNLFMVGDVKQSIYRFRLAEPGIFLEKYRSYRAPYEDGASIGTKILLQENFRSRRAILDSANHVFSNILSEALGELSYDGNAALKFGAPDYPDGTDVTPELCLIDPGRSDIEGETPEKSELEALYVARRIREMVSSGVKVYERDASRPCTYADFAVLMRSPSGKGHVFRRVLEAEGIPVQSQQGGDYFSRLEVAVTMNLLAVIDNPHNDVPLISVLRSPVFCFTPDELSQIRAFKKDGDFYGALCAKAEDDEHCKAFLEALRAMRERAPDLGIDELLWYIFSATGLFAICTAMDDGAARRANLMYLFECAKRFEESGYKGLFQFTAYLRRMAERNEEPPVSGGESDYVRITSIHKSKGLEYPFVFLCDLSHKFNKQDLRENLLIHPKLGLGPKVTDVKSGIEFPTAARNAIKLTLEDELLSEEMRVLYVAMTRARERLVMTCVTDKADEVLQNARLNPVSPVPVQTLRHAQSMSAWLISAACLDEGEKHIKTRVIALTDSKKDDARPENDTAVNASAEALASISEKLDFVYPHGAVSALPSKLTATEIKRRLSQWEPDSDSDSLPFPLPERDFRWPDFDGSKKPSAAQRGTATHCLLEHIDFGRTGSIVEIKGEIARLEAAGLLNAEEAAAADPEMVLALFASPLGERMKSADRVCREFRFTLLEDASKYYDIPEGESLLLQGIIDCFIIEDGEITVIDYKTDNISAGEAAGRAEAYAPQLRTYAQALSRIFGTRVKQTLIYFLRPGICVVQNR